MTSKFFSFFLPADRSSSEEIKKSYKNFSSNPHIKVVIDAVPNIILIIDRNRQIVFSNNKFAKSLGEENMESILGKRPGEFMYCKNSINDSGGCGTSEGCKYCGAALSIQKSISEAILSENECRITVENSGITSNLDLHILATPIYLADELYVILSINDISNEKRRKVLERVFFHDVLNTAGGLKGILELIATNPDITNKQELLDVAASAVKILVEEIQAQRTLLSAENGELTVNFLSIEPLRIIEDVRNTLCKHDVASGIQIELFSQSNSSIILSDPMLLKRCLINLLKNALEASSEGDTVNIGFEEKNSSLIFFVKNKAVLSEEAKLQIFQRSFSTKGMGRGVGTYSVKLFTETYLKGNVDFASDPVNGTVFNLRLPINHTE